MSIFSEIDAIPYEGQQSQNALAYRTYDKDRIVLGKPMSAWLRLSVCWHSFSWSGKDMFGEGTLPRPWLGASQAMAEQKCEAAFDFLSRLGVPYFTFHDLDAMAAASTLAEHEAALKRIEEKIAAKMAETGIGLLWGAADLFTHPRYAAGAATNPDPDVFAFAAFQVRSMLETTQRLGGENYLLSGYREGYDTLLNTDIAADLDHLGRFLAMVVEHKHKIGFKGALLLEPTPFEPAKHHYERDVAAVFAFLERYGLDQEIKVNIEVNHATLAGLDFEHELAAAQAYDLFGSIDINRGDPRNGWATDHFPNNAQDLTPALLLFLEGGGFISGGFNFDAKLRRQSLDANDLYLAHIAGIDTLAQALLAAERVLMQKRLSRLREERYAGWNTALGRDIAEGRHTLETLADLAVLKHFDPKPRSGKQELAESIIAQSAHF